MMDKIFGIVSEGVTDFAVLENILFGITGNKDLEINPLQPKPSEAGNWDKVFKYCQSSDFKAAFAYCDFVIIQIDTDFMHTGEVPAAYKIDLHNLSVEEIIRAFQEKFISLISNDFYQEYQNQVIFAISVNEIECWLLPIYFENQKQKAEKVSNCIKTLNEVLPQKEGFYIHEKKVNQYEKMSKPFRKLKDLQRFAAKNPSFALFLNEIEQKIDAFCNY